MLDWNCERRCSLLSFLESKTVFAILMLRYFPCHILEGFLYGLILRKSFL